MPALFIYLIKANIVLTLFYLAYRFGLRRLTFYTLNRYFLLSGIACAALFPLLNFQDLFQSQAQEAAIHSTDYYAIDWNALQQYAASENFFTIWNILQYIFWTGAAVMLIRFVFQLISLLKIHLQSESGKINNESVKLMSGKINPFSFFKNLYINPALHSPDELHTILSHERIHMRQWHSLDILAGEINHIFYWFNPGAWLMKTAIRENLEFITDRALLKSGINAKKYQYILLKTVTGQQGVQLANNFNLSHLKKRIMMMNKTKSSDLHLLRYLLMLPLLATISLLMSSSEAQTTSTAKKYSSIIKKTVISATPTDTIPESQKHLPDDYKAFLRRNPSINDIHWSNPVDGRATIAIIYFKNGKRDKIHLTDPAEVKKVTMKYGKLPIPPTPPPPKPKVIYTPPKVIKDTFSKPKVKYTPPKVVRDDVIYKHPKTTIDTAKSKVIRYDVIYKHPKTTIDTVKPSVKYTPPKVVRDEVIHKHPKTVVEFASGFKGIYIIDDKVVASPKGLDTNSIASIAVLKDTIAKYLYGQKAKNGVIIIHTKKNRESDKDSLPKNVLYIIDGKEANGEDFKKLSPEDIYNISVVKDKRAANKYGEKGKNGVIIIKTKDFIKENPDTVKEAEAISH